MPISLEITGEIGRIILMGTFDFSEQDTFRQIIDETINNEKIGKIIVDMAGVIFMDSSAIRLLLLLNQKAVAGGRSLTLTNCPRSLREIFSIGGFDNVLTIQ
jgi:HptB-dependent secretion and biofilm anti anti-sigma factor